MTGFLITRLIFVPGNLSTCNDTISLSDDTKYGSKTPLKSYLFIKMVVSRDYNNCYLLNSRAVLARK